MYRVFRASALYYEYHMRGAKGRYEWVKPFMLLTDTAAFIKAKKTRSENYLNLCDILGRMKELYHTGEEKYHHFQMLLQEFQILGFDLHDILPEETTDEERLKAQIDLLLQFLSFRYCFDAFDNKTGTHDTIKNTFIFIQP